MLPNRQPGASRGIPLRGAGRSPVPRFTKSCGLVVGRAACPPTSRDTLGGRVAGAGAARLTVASNRARPARASLYHHPSPPPLINTAGPTRYERLQRPSRLARLRDKPTGAAHQCIGLLPKPMATVANPARSTDPSTAQSTHSLPLTVRSPLSAPPAAANARGLELGTPDGSGALTYRIHTDMYRTFGRAYPYIHWILPRRGSA